MSYSSNPAYSLCPSKGKLVSIDQTEGQCRDSHNCGDGACPLEGDFGKDRFHNALAALSAGIGLGIPGRLRG
ncbi:MAG: hypothetical protein KDK89_08845 [Alphaproteobacteria bacterium]|nr:hypothetical protein [Alphaproteobacteria bacterium]